MPDIVTRLRDESLWRDNAVKAQMVEAAAEIERLRAALTPFSDAYRKTEAETARLTQANPARDWQFAGTGYREVLADQIAPTWFRDAHNVLAK